MALLLVAFAVVVLFCLWGGILLIRRGLRPSKPPPIAEARIANAEGGDATYQTAARVATRAPRKIGKAILVSTGVALVTAPWIALYSVITGLSDFDMKKGRVLRIRNRAELAELAEGEGWAGEAVELEVPGPELRGALAELWLLTARMEHASVAAFALLSQHLAALGAPARLLAATHRAALDEIRHAERCFAIARALTGVAHTAGPIPALAGTGAPIDLVRLAIGSLVDGCVAEGIAADVAAAGSEVARAPVICATLAMIARDEATHAELAWDVLAWCVACGGDDVERAVAARVERLDAELTPRLPDITGDHAALARYGVIDQDALGRIASARIRAVQQRGRALLGGALARAA